VMVCEVRAGPRAEQSGAVIADAPDGIRWVALPQIQQGCEAQLAWGAAQGATHGYVRMPEDDRAAAVLARSLGFVLHHHSRYITLT
jgi:N-acetylglutamate synthase